MAFGAAAAGPAPEHAGSYGSRPEYLDAMRSLIAHGMVDVMFTSASNGERLAGDGSLDDDVTLAVRANDTTDIWNMRGGSYPTLPSRPFRSAHLPSIRPFCDLVLYSVTFNNDLERDLATLEAYRRVPTGGGRARHAPLPRGLQPERCGAPGPRADRQLCQRLDRAHARRRHRAPNGRCS